MILCSLSLVDIDVDTKPLYNLPIFVSQGFSTTHMPTINAVCSPGPMFGSVGTPARKSLVKFLDNVFTFLWVNDLNPSPVLDLIHGQSAIVSCLPVDERGSAVRC